MRIILLITINSYLLLIKLIKETINKIKYYGFIKTYLIFYYLSYFIFSINNIIIVINDDIKKIVTITLLKNFNNL